MSGLRNTVVAAVGDEDVTVGRDTLGAENRDGGKQGRNDLIWRG
jgi:hypothetical protein